MFISHNLIFQLNENQTIQHPTKKQLAFIIGIPDHSRA